MPQLTAPQLGGKNVAAFLDMIAVSEGTDNGRQRTKDRGYDVMVGGGLVPNYVDHPRKLVSLPRYGIKSSAAGRYQFLKRTWGGLVDKLGLPDFSPASQDLACVELLKQRRAYLLIQAGKWVDAVQACSKEWASLPGAGYGQHEQKLDTLRAAYLAAGGTIN
jgi:muramidase (phage lysozyme)